MFPLSRLAPHWQFHVLVAFTVVLWDTFIPNFSTVVRISCTVVVDDEIVLVKSIPDNFLVALIVDLVVDVSLILDLVCL